MMTEAGQLIADAHADRPARRAVDVPARQGRRRREGRAPHRRRRRHRARASAPTSSRCNPPKGDDTGSSAEKLKEASKASGRTGLVCAGGSTVDATTFLTQLYEQIHVGGAIGNATGRNIHQRSLDEAVRLTKAISAITLGDYDVDRALAVFNGTEDFSL